ncbi:MAG: PH domain-containing protein [Solirubrobacterales bacterium]|nr:PH domain-containing protein [Solirubrobacterales bacterium]
MSDAADPPREGADRHAGRAGDPTAPDHPRPIGPPTADGRGPRDARPALAARHLHPVAAVLAALDNVRDAVVSVVVLLVIGSQSGRLGTMAAWLAVGGAALAVSVGYARWRAETYAVVDATIRHRHGLISRDETVVPLARVHSIDTAQGPLQRLFGVYELHVQTAGGGARGEIVLRAVDPGETARLRTAAGLAAEARTDDLPRWRLTTRDLLVVGVTAPQVGILLPLVGGAVALADSVLGESGAREALIERAPTEAGGLALLAAAALALIWLVAFAGALVAFAGFAVVRDGDHLRIERGFLQRRATSVPLARVQAVSVAEGLLRRPFGLCSVRLETAGYGREAGAARTLFPLLRTAELDSRLGDLVPGLAAATTTSATPSRAAAPDRAPAGSPGAPAGAAAPPSADGDWQRPPGRALRRYLLPRTLAGLAAGALAAAIWPVAWPLAPVLALAGAAVGLAAFRAAGWRLAGGRLAARHGALNRRTVLVSAGRLQDHSLGQTPFQRRARLATFSITVASGTSAAVAHLDAAPAQALFDRLRPTPGR